MRTLVISKVFVAILLVAFSTGCKFNLTISKVDSGSTENDGGGAPSVPLVLDYSKSTLEIKPEASQIPVSGVVTLKYCLKDQNGDAFDRPDLDFAFSLADGSSSGALTSVTYNSTDKCYESNFTANASGTPVEIIPQVNSAPVESSQAKHIEVTLPRLGFTGNSSPSANLNDRIFNQLSGPRIIEGNCDPILGEVILNGGLDALTTTACQNDGTFSVSINVDGAASPHFKVSPFPDPLIMIKQGNLKPQMTRLYRVHTDWTNVFISNATELQAMTVASLNQMKNYFLTTDIDLSTVSATNNFTPLGSSGSSFWSGRLFGDGHIINNLHINGGTGNYKGIFGYVNANAYITDIKIENGTVIGGGYVGLLAGELRLSYAHRISLTGSVSGVGLVGLLAGNSWDGEMREVVASGTVSASDSNVGGIAGRLRGGEIINSWSDVVVTATTSGAGGLTGYAWQGSDMYIENSFSMGSISGNSAVGGAVGIIQDISTFYFNYFRNSFSLADVSATTIAASGISGPVVGSAGTYSDPNYTPDPDNIISGLYYLSTANCTNCTSPNTHASGESLENILSWSQTVWDYEWVWQIHSSGTRPDLLGNPRP